MGCTQGPIIGPVETIDRGMVFPTLNDKIFCRGKGYILSEGDIQGRLNFTFTASRDTAYIQFKDLIGRKTLFLILGNETIDA